MQILGLGIGGANLKAATPKGQAQSIPFALWKQPASLSNALLEIKSRLLENTPIDHVALTMTGELCDCFETKADGVRHIIASAKTAFADCNIAVWQVDGRFVSTSKAVETAWKSAASNWSALANACLSVTENKPSLLVDIGSTTTDIIPIDQVVASRGFDDATRLALGELLYQGVMRTPICAILKSVRLAHPPVDVEQASRSLPRTTNNGQDSSEIRTMAEFFATSRDAYVILGLLPESADSVDTADGRPMTRSFALSRLARMIGSDSTRFGFNHAHEMASAVFGVQRRALAAAMIEVMDRSLQGKLEQIITSGVGEFLIEATIRDDDRFSDATTISLTNLWGGEISKSACAYAAAILLKSRLEVANADSPSLG